MSSAARTALIVEDEFMVRGFIADCLQFKGFHTLKASSTLSALELARQYEGRIDLLISDFCMPEIPGPDFAAILTSERPETKVLLVSGAASPHAVEALPPSWGFLPKPFNFTSLMAAIGPLLPPAP